MGGQGSHLIDHDFSCMSNDQHVLQSILEGDEAAIEAAYQSCRSKCIAFLRNRFNYATELAAELYNDAFVQMWHNVLNGQLETLTHSLLAYITGIVENLALDEIKTRERQRRILEKVGAQASQFQLPQHEFEDAEERRRVQLLLDRLSERCRKLLVMHFFLRFDDHDVGEDLDIPYDRVRKERYKCLERARGEFEKLSRL